MSQRSIEVKVGILILAALGLLSGFVLVMGGVSFEPTFTVYVDFENPGGLQTGAPVKLAGVKVGTVTEIQFRGGIVDPMTGVPEPPIRIGARLEKRYQPAVYDDSRWFVTSQGVLGEMFLAIEPGSPSHPPLQDGAIVPGASPPRLDLLLSESYELLHKAYLALVTNEGQIKETFDGLHRTLKGSGDFFERNQERLDRIVANVEGITREAESTLTLAKERYVEGPQISRIMNNIERSTAALNENLTPLARDLGQITADTKKITALLSAPEQLSRYDALLRDMSAAAHTARGTMTDAQEVLQHVKRGRGTLGAFVMDEAVYDDFQELIRDLKHNPWKFFWRQ